MALSSVSLYLSDFMSHVVRHIEICPVPFVYFSCPEILCQMPEEKKKMFFVFQSLSASTTLQMTVAVMLVMTCSIFLSDRSL